MMQKVRNAGRPGIASHAIAAVDSALWDLKARLLDVPLVTLLGRAPDDVPVYGSGGFTSYSKEELLVDAKWRLRPQVQADATRCCGIIGFLQAGALCEAFHIPLSAHTAPSLHLAPCRALPSVRDIESFHDHVRIEQRFFDGVRRAENGRLAPDLAIPGHGLTVKRADLEGDAVTS